MSSHTPGPWKVNPDSPWIVYCSTGSMVAATEHPDLPQLLSKRSRLANARLIAAAPELLEALKAQDEATEYAKALSSLAKDGTKLTPSHIEEGHRRIERAQMLRRAAIAKAEGRT